MWRNRSYGETVKTFIDKLVLWQLAGYVNGQVWEQMGTIVDPSLLPTNLPLPIATKRWDDDYGNSVPIIPCAGPAVSGPAPCVFEEECK